MHVVQMALEVVVERVDGAADVLLHDFHAGFQGLGRSRQVLCGLAHGGAGLLQGLEVVGA
ncbi:hypothetical protein D3C71_1760240 [compost metagenome]